MIKPVLRFQKVDPSKIVFGATIGMVLSMNKKTLFCGLVVYVGAVSLWFGVAMPSKKRVSSTEED